MLVRALTRGDIATLREIDRLSFAETDQYSAAYYEQFIVSGTFDAIGVADEDGRIAAWALVDLSSDPIRIRSLAVHPDSRRRGIGTALVKAVLGKHPGPVDLLVAPQNASAIALYRKFGFVQGDPDPALPERLRMVLPDDT